MKSEEGEKKNLSFMGPASLKSMLRSRGVLGALQAISWPVDLSVFSSQRGSNVPEVGSPGMQLLGPGSRPQHHSTGIWDSYTSPEAISLRPDA